MPFTSYSQINTLDEFSIVGGSDITLQFTVYDENGSPVNLTGATCTLVIAPYGQPSTVITTLTGTVSSPTNVVSYILPNATTIVMVGGKYMYQPIIVDTVPKTYRPNQGVFTVVQAIG
jgi:hypothetical protein